MFFKIVALKNFAHFTWKHLCRNLFLIKLQALKIATWLKRRSYEICKIFQNTLIYRTSPVAAFDSFRFPAGNFLKKRDFGKDVFSVNFAKILRNIFWQNTSGWLIFKFNCNFKKFFRASPWYSTSEELLISTSRCRI